MGNVTLPTPVFVATGALCLVAGYLVGTLSGPGTPQRTTATVSSFDARSSTLCLTGESVADEELVGDDGELCGIWTRSPGSRLPEEGDRFRYVAQDTSGVTGAVPGAKVLIFGTVVK